MFEIAGPAPLEPARLRLLEPPGSSEAELQRRLTQGTYDKPFIVDSGPLRLLHFDLDNVQSAMFHADPDALCLAYTRKMMSFLLFNSEPQRLLLLGLGGGSLAKFCYRHLHTAHITVLEIDPHVMAFRDEFRVPADDQRFRVLNTDGVYYVASRSERQDVILVDACDRNGVAPALSDPHVYANLRRKLALRGILVMNICGEGADVEGHLGRICGVFGTNIITLPAQEDGNLIVMAFRTPPRLWDGVRLDRHARNLADRFGLDFPRYARKMVYGIA